MMCGTRKEGAISRCSTCRRLLRAPEKSALRRGDHRGLKEQKSVQFATDVNFGASLAVAGQGALSHGASTEGSPWVNLFQAKTLLRRGRDGDPQVVSNMAGNLRRALKAREGGVEEVASKWVHMVRGARKEDRRDPEYMYGLLAEIDAWRPGPSSS